MADALPITPKDLAAARAQFADDLLPCPHCAGWAPAQANQIQFYSTPTICIEEPAAGLTLQTWKVKCWSCSASVGGQALEDAVTGWNRRAP